VNILLSQAVKPFQQSIVRPVVLLALLVSLVCFAFFGSTRVYAAGEPAGRILMAIGDVSVSRDGASIVAKKDTIVLSGDTVVTKATSNAQLRLNDGAVIALRPNTEFKINEFVYSGKADGKERASVSLVKGGVRAVTGVIGRGNRDNLKVDAVVATVGIRGTGFNIVFCDAACKSASPTAKEGLYAGVFEGKIDVANRAGQATELGVNRFAYVQDANAPPQMLIAPPSFLKDSLEAQVRVQPKELVMNSVTENNSATLESSKAVEKSPSGGGEAPKEVSAEKVNTVKVELEPPDVVKFYPAQFFDSSLPVSPDDRLQSTGASRVLGFQSAEFNEAGNLLKAGNNFYKGLDNYTNVGAESNSNGQVTELSFEVLSSRAQYYSIKQTYVNGVATAWSSGTKVARQVEGGAAGGAASTVNSGVIAWGRWADGVAYLGSYGNVVFSENDGFHWIAGERIIPTGQPSQPQNWSFNLIGGTTPTEARTNALPGWRLTGGKFDASVSSSGSVNASGLLNLYYARESDGWGNYTMNFTGTSTTIATTELSGTVSRVNGSANICTGPCGANGSLGFYGSGSNVSHAGITYQFNTGPTVVQGAAVFAK
jgi:hypothetical protein